VEEDLLPERRLVVGAVAVGVRLRRRDVGGVVAGPRHEHRVLRVGDVADLDVQFARQVQAE